MVSPFSALRDTQVDNTFIEEVLPQEYRNPISPTVMAGYNERLDLIALRIYGTNHDIVLRTLIWSNPVLGVSNFLRLIPEGTVLITPNISAEYYARPQFRIRDVRT